MVDVYTSIQLEMVANSADADEPGLTLDCLPLFWSLVCRNRVVHRVCILVRLRCQYNMVTSMIYWIPRLRVPHVGWQGIHSRLVRVNNMLRQSDCRRHGQ
jgi:hypothetical protein